MEKFEEQAIKQGKEIAERLHMQHAATPDKADAEVMKHMSDHDRFSGAERVARVREAEVARAYLAVLREKDRAADPTSPKPILRSGSVASQNWQKVLDGLSPTGQPLLSQTMAVNMGRADLLTDGSQERWKTVKVRDFSLDPKGKLVHNLPQRGRANLAAMVATAAMGVVFAAIAKPAHSEAIDMSGIKETTPAVAPAAAPKPGTPTSPLADAVARVRATFKP